VVSGFVLDNVLTKEYVETTHKSPSTFLRRSCMPSDQCGIYRQ